MDNHSNSHCSGEKRGLGVCLLSGAAAAERFSYYCVQTVLIFFMIHAFYDEAASAQVKSSFISFMVTAVIVGAMASDFFVRCRRFLLWGGILMSIGYFALFLGACVATPLAVSENTVSKIVVLAGLVFIAAGNGLFRPAVWSSAGKLFDPKSTQRDGVFVLLAFLINLGAFIGTIIMIVFNEFRMVLLIAAVMMTVGTALIYYFTKKCPYVFQNDVSVSCNSQFILSDSQVNGIDASNVPDQFIENKSTNNDCNTAHGARTVKSEPLYKSLFKGSGLIISVIVSAAAAVIVYCLIGQVLKGISVGLGCGIFSFVLLNSSISKMDKKKFLFSGLLLLIMTMFEFLFVRTNVFLAGNFNFFNLSFMMYFCAAAAILGIILFVFKSLKNRIRKTSFFILGIAAAAIPIEILFYYLSTLFMNQAGGTACLSATFFLTIITELLLCPMILSVVTRLSPIQISGCVLAVYFACLALVDVFCDISSKLMASVNTLGFSDNLFYVAFIVISALAAVLYFVFRSRLESAYDKLMEDKASV